MTDRYDAGMKEAAATMARLGRAPKPLTPQA